MALAFRSLPGFVSYEEARKLQLDLLQQRVEDQIEDTVLFLEHTPVITQGRGLQWKPGVTRDRHMPVPMLLPPGVEFSESERGGDLTYHGPGQLVIYPICKLGGDGFMQQRDIGQFLRKLEQVAIAVIQNLTVAPQFAGAAGVAGAMPGIKTDATGVWIGDRKVASIGIAVRKWVTYHGIAINCVNDLSPFFAISPCGFSAEVMTRLADVVSLRDDWRAQIEGLWQQEMGRG